MSSKMRSPTAQLLRSSRLFSLPPPLLRPNQHETRGRDSSTIDRTPESATTPYPIQQAIETPSSSRSRGDWGLKRALPLKSTTKSSKTQLRITAIDTIEHVTDFEPASTHTMTVRKLHAMNVPMTTFASQRSLATGVAQSPRSVYEDEHDNTYTTEHLREMAQLNPSANRGRWRFRGPWVPGMVPSEFEAFTKQIRKRKDGFDELVRSKMQRRRFQEHSLRARAVGEPVIPESQIKVSDQEVADYIKTLRNNFSVGSELSNLIREFLDLPNLSTDRTGSFGSFSGIPTVRGSNETRDVFQTAIVGPPKTHPGAGLSYIKTGAVLENDPILGPRASVTPVQARVVVPKSMSRGSNRALLGVGGVLTEEPLHGRASAQVDKSVDNTKEIRGLQQHDFEIEGGTKIWVEPQRATIDARGRIDLSLNHADVKNVAMHTGEWAIGREGMVVKGDRALPFSQDELKNAMGERLNSASTSQEIIDRMKEFIP